MAIDYDIYLGDEEVIDGLGSVIINLNSTGSPEYDWATNELIQAYGTPIEAMGSVIPHVDTVSYKIKSMDIIPEHNDPNSTWGDAACLSSPTTCNKRGPFTIFGRRYFIDFMFLYFYNSGDENLYSPLYSVDDSKCDENYGYFIGTPAVGPNETVTASNLMTFAPTYTNDLDALDENILYKFTTVDGSDNIISDNLYISSIIDLVQSTVNNGQTVVASEDDTGGSITLQPGDFHPFIIMRYVSENAPTRPIDITFRYGPYIA